MGVTVKAISAPAAATVGIEEVQVHCRCDTPELQSLLVKRERAAVEYFENRSARALVERDFRQVWDAFDDEGLQLWRAPAIAVATLTYRNTAGDWVELDEDEYELHADCEPALITPADAWPSDVSDLPGSVKCEFTAGYGDSGADVPEDIRNAVAMLAAHWLQHPEAVVTGTITQEVEMGVRDAIENHRYVWVV